MLKDRGTKKWTAMMLPEHVEGIRALIADLDKVEKPTLDEQQLEEFERIIAEAIEYQQTVTIEYWKDGYVISVVGTINHVDINTKQLRVFVNEVDRLYVPIDCLVKITN